MGDDKRLLTPEEGNPDAREDKLSPGDLSDSSRTIRWLDNFWYHYKWQVIIAVFFLVILIIGVVQIVTRVQYDMYVAMAVPYTMNAEEKDKFTDLLQKVCPRDYNGDGDVLVCIQPYQVYSDEEYQSEKAYWEAESQQFFINSVYNRNQLNEFNSYLKNGECTVLLVSPYIYGEKVGNGHLLPIADVYGDEPLPPGVTADGYGIRLSDTDFYKYNPAAQVLPADTLLCLQRPMYWSNRDEQDYAADREMFRAIADYRVRE